MTEPVSDVTIPARDGYSLAGTAFTPEAQSIGVVLIASAVAVPRQFYRRFASFLAEVGYTVVTFDYRGVGGSKHGSLRDLDADCTDWALEDFAGVIDWIHANLDPDRFFVVGHSFGGQVTGLLDNTSRITAMATFSSQSAHWRLQGGNQKWPVGLHAYVTLPLMSTVVGYAPWSWFGAGEDLPAGVAKQWASWVRLPGYLLEDSSLPLDRYTQFTAPVLAHSIDDDDWGTAKAVDALMLKAYPNVERRHIVPSDHDIDRLGHMGYFKGDASSLWPELTDWFASV